jgi:tetratricopeptide (TPR) repeat protein
LSRLLATGLVVALALSAGRAADVQPAGDAAAMGQELNAIRDQLVALDIEKALAALEALLARPELTEETRADALDLRAQAHVASDNLDAAEKDYRAILQLRAGYVPGRDVTSKKAMDRFKKIQASLIGTVRLDVDPKDTAITVDGRPVAVPANAALPVVAGERSLGFTHKGFDPQDVTLRAVAGQETLARIRMVPNARSLVVRTDVDGVAVSLDGVPSGVTARGSEAGSGVDAPAVLQLEDVSIGEHELSLSKTCFAPESLAEIVTVDLADRSPRLLRIVAMRPARAKVAATGASYEGELRVDGERVASLPLTSFAACPGVRALEVVASGRVVWSGNLTADESGATVDLSPRPSVVLVGAAWPKAWSAASETWSLRGRVDLPAGVDLTTADGWKAVALPPGTDLAVAVIPRAGVAGDERVVLYGPALNEVEERATAPRPARPTWNVGSLGVTFADGAPGTLVVASASAAGPAARAGLLAGDRLSAVSGRAVATAATARDAIAGSGVGAKVVLDVVAPSGTARKIECATSAEPRLSAMGGDDASRIARAAWASVDAAAGGPDGAAALANLASLLERAGRNAAALDAWRRVRAVGAGALAARAAYAVGAGLQAEGKRAEAIEAFGQARTGGAASGDVALAAAAGDRLADLGVAPH